MAEGPRTFRELDVWRLAMDAAIDCYRLTARFPADERYGLVAQLRRAAASIPSNIAEGHNRHARGAYANHVHIALGSQAEVETLLELAERLSYAPADQLLPLVTKVQSIGRMLHGLARALARGSISVPRSGTL